MKLIFGFVGWAATAKWRNAAPELGLGVGVSKATNVAPLTDRKRPLNCPAAFATDAYTTRVPALLCTASSTFVVVPLIPIIPLVTSVHVAPPSVDSKTPTVLTAA